MHPPIEIGNGYGYFCDLDKPKKIYTHKRFYIEEVYHDNRYSSTEPYYINIYTTKSPITNKMNESTVNIHVDDPVYRDVYRDYDCEPINTQNTNNKCKTGINILQFYGLFITTMLIYTLFIT
jgi:hypothetical protein